MMSEHIYYGHLDSELGWLDRVDDKRISIRFIRSYNVDYAEVATRSVTTPRAALYPPPDIGTDVPGGGAV